jgi:hypothetical protein
VIAGMDCSSAAAGSDLWISDIPPKDLCPANGRSAVLGRMPWVSRATAIKPDVKQSNRDWLRVKVIR